MLQLFTMPSPSTYMPQIGSHSSAWFDALWPVAVVVIGISIAGLLAAGLIRWIIQGISHFVHPAQKYD